MTQLNISNIQHFSVGDGAGIRTTIFFKGCNLHCPWCHNPETIPSAPSRLVYSKIGKQEICGRLMNIEDVLKEALEDRDYFEESGGGVTLSGGEVLLQYQGAKELAMRLKEHGISVIVDTAGCVSYDAFEALNPYVDEYLYDIKSASPTQYAQIIGGNLDRVVQNLAHLLQDHKNVRVRIPLIPGFNTDPSSISALCCLLRDLDISSVDLLPFHRLGSGKYEALGLSYSYRQTPPLSGEPLHLIEKQFAHFFQVNTEH